MGNYSYSSLLEIELYIGLINKKSYEHWSNILKLQNGESSQNTNGTSGNYQYNLNVVSGIRQ